MDDKVKEVAYEIFCSWMTSGRDGDPHDDKTVIDQVCANYGVRVDDVMGLTLDDMVKAARDIEENHRKDFENSLVEAIGLLQSILMENAQGE